jgi:hypothetical protein
MAQMILNLIVLGLGVRLIVGATQRARQTNPDGETEANLDRLLSKHWCGAGAREARSEDTQPRTRTRPFAAAGRA